MLHVKKPAVFLDRDGVLTEEKSYIASKKDFSIFPYAAECVRMIHEKGYYAIVITNQSGIARGIFTEDALLEMNDFLIQQTKADAVYYCPHHPKGILEKYKKNCQCRKPGTGMFKMACERFPIDMQNSYMVGDRATDILAGQNMGIKTVLLESGYGTAGLEQNVTPDYRLKDLRDVIEIL
ncbi:D-glycero-beta-D-manno-heptose-1,7-bisphosphate 7-phosphatase [Lachnospiraceae bacterium]|nr:D-glycero-beta-D-manno-heptose-1,7-bisphosphate 7-phosphatase [Lachnospiraceae bacterium]